MFGQDWPPYATLGFIVALILALWAVFHIAQSRSGPLGKAIWIVAVLFLPYLGFIAWLIFGPRAKRGG
ncbi:MAG: PLD nuclease N-terminal domain-containing protein [Hyphomonadaceae bacterium]